MTEFTPHSAAQDTIIFSDTRLTVAATGTQFGKSIAGSLWIQRQILSETDPKANFLVMAPTYKIMNQSMVPYFLDVMQGRGTYRKSDALFEMNNGQVVYMRTEKDPDSIVGIPRVRAYWLDEAGKVGLYFWENVQARAASVGAKGLLTTSPYSRNWLYKDIIKPKMAGKLPEITFVKAASWENPYHTLHDPAERARVAQLMDPRRFSMVFGGEWGQMSGLVYDCWDEVENQCPAFELPPGTRFFGGIDWGFTDPFVLKVRAITPDGNHYGISEFYQTGLTLPRQIEIAKQKRALWPIEVFFADPSRPDNIKEFNNQGVPTQKAENSIRVGVDAHYELIKTRRLKYFQDTHKYTVDEIESYHYPEPEDLGPDDESKEQDPVGQNDHALDADRYISIMTKFVGLRTAPKNSEQSMIPVKKVETFEQRVKRLTRLNTNKQTEDFS